MQDSEVRQLDRSQRVRQLLGTLTPPFPEGSRGAELSAALADAITQTVQQAARQDAATLDRQESTEQKEAAINSLLEQMRAINRTARSINKQFPGIADQFRMPGDSDQATLNRARAFIVAATPIAAEFTSRGLPDSFLTDLQAAIERVEAAETRQSAALATQTAATAGVAAALKREQVIVSELDAIMHNRFHDDPSMLAAWQSASRIERAPKKTKKPAPPEPPPSS